MTLDAADERGANAGEYVLGTLDRDDREAFEQALQKDPSLLAEVYFWQDRLVHLTSRVTPQTPDRELWPAIESKLESPVSVPRVMQHSASGSAANDAVWRRLRHWRWIGSCAVALSVFLATVLGAKMLSLPADPPARYLAVLQAPQDQSTGWIVEVTRGQHVRLIPVGPPVAVPVGKALQFWTKPDGAASPTSLGLVSASGRTELPAKLLPAVGERQLFELTLEPEAGSPIGRPTGPILFVGRTVRL